MNILGINARDIGNHQVGRLNALARFEAMAREERLELCAKEEINPNKQDRCHA